MTDCPCCSEPWVLGEQSAEGDTPWNTTSKLYLYLGQVSATIITSHDPGFSGVIQGHSLDGLSTFLTETDFGAGTRKLMRLSGQFTSTVQSSLDVTSGSTQLSDVCWAGASTYWLNRSPVVRMDFVEQSGKFTSTVKQSVRNTTYITNGLTIGDGDTLTMLEIAALNWVDFYRFSGQFTTTLKSTFRNTGNVEEQGYLTYDGSNTLAGMLEFPGSVNTIVVYSGAFTSTVKASANHDSVGTLTGLNSNQSNVG